MEEQKNQLLAIHQSLETGLTKQADALPKNFNKTRFIQNCMTVLQDSTLDYSKCDPSTVGRTLLKGAFLGLDFFNKECYAIPYGNKCNFQTDYKGEIKLAKMYSTNPILDIYAKVVKKGDYYEEVIVNGKQSIDFKPIPFNDEEIIGAFAVVLFKDGSMLYDTMSKAEIEKTKTAFSKAPNSKAWKETPGEMYKKTVLRRLCKLIDLNFDTLQAQLFEETSDFDVTKELEHEKPLDPFANAVEVESTVVEEVIDEVDGE